MANCSPSPSEQREPGRRRSAYPEFLSHLHTRTSAPDRSVSTTSNNLLSGGQAAGESSRVVSPAAVRRPLRVSFGMTHPGDDTNRDKRIGDRRAAHQHEEAGGTCSTSSGAYSNNAVGETSRFHRSTTSAVRDGRSEHTRNADGEVTFRCSSTMHKTLTSNESSGFDLVGAIICGPSESPVSSISSHRYSGKSLGGGEEMLDSWLRKTIKLRQSAVIGKRGIKGVPIVPKSLIELAKARQEREAIEESDDSDSDSTSSSSTSEAADGRRNSGGRNVAKRVVRASVSRSAVPMSPRVTFRSPEESLSDAIQPPLLAYKSEGDGRDGAGKEKKGRAGTPTLATSRSAISITPRVTFKSLAVSEETPFAASPLVLGKTSERDFRHRRTQSRVIRGVRKSDIRKAGGGHQGLLGGGSSPVPVKDSPAVSPVAVEPMSRAAAGIQTTVMASTGDSYDGKGAGTTKCAPGAAAAVLKTAANGRPSAISAFSRTNDSRREFAAGSLARSDPPRKSTASTPEQARTSDTPNTTSSPPGMSVSLTAEGTAQLDSARVGFLPKEGTAPKVTSEGSPSATLHPEAVHSSHHKRETQEAKSPEMCCSDQDTEGSGATPAENEVGSPMIMDKGGVSSTPQDTVVGGKDTATVDTVRQGPPSKTQLDTSEGAKTLDESVSIPSGSILERVVPELDGTASGVEDSEEECSEAKLGQLDDEVYQKTEGEQQSGDEKQEFVQAIRGKDTDAMDTARQGPPSKTQLDTSGGAKTLDESVSIPSGSILERVVPELDCAATGSEDSKEERFEADLGRIDGEVYQKAEGEQQSGDENENFRRQECGPVRGAAREQEVGGKEGTRSAQKSPSALLALAADESDRTQHPGRDGDENRGDTEQTALPNTITERTAANEDSRSTVLPPAAHPVTCSQQRETTPVANKEQESSQSPPAMAPAVHATIPMELLLGSAIQQIFGSSQDPNATLQHPVQALSSAGGGECDGGGKENDPTTILGTPSHDARHDTSPPRPPAAHPFAGPHRRDMHPVTVKERESSQPPPVTAPAVHPTISTEFRVDSAVQQRFESPPDPNFILRHPIQQPSSAGGGDTNGGGKENGPMATLGQPRHDAHHDASSGESSRTRGPENSLPEAPLTRGGDDARQQQHARVLVEATATRGNGGHSIRSAANSSAAVPCSGCDGGVSCDDMWRSGDGDFSSIDWRLATPIEARKGLVVGDLWCMNITSEAATKIATGGSKEKLSACSPPVKQLCKDGHTGADVSTRTQEEPLSSESRPRDLIGSGTEVEKDGLSASCQAENSRETATINSVKEPAVVFPVEMMREAPQRCAHENAKGGAGGIDPALSVSQLWLASTAPSSVARDPWSVRILVEAWATLASCGVPGRSSYASLETVSGLLPSVVGGRCSHEVRRAERRHSACSGGRCSVTNGRRKRLSLPIMRIRSSRSIGRRKRSCLPIAQAASSEGDVATSVCQWTSCGSESSKLPIIVDGGSCLVGGAAPKLVMSRGRAICDRDAEQDSTGPTKNTDDSPRPSQDSPQGSQREGRTRGQENVLLVPTRPPGMAHSLDGMSTCASRASLASGRRLAVGGSQREGEYAPVEFSGHIVVSPAWWTAGGDDGDSCGRGFVAGGRGRRLSLPAPQKRSAEDTVNAAIRRTTDPSPPQLPIVVDAGRAS